MESISNFITEYNLDGLVVGLLTFLIIGMFHPLVIKGEYYLGQRSCVLFLIAGVASAAGSLASSGLCSILLGVISCSSFWSILEVKEQRERVRKGWFPSNPRREEKHRKSTCNDRELHRK